MILETTTMRKLIPLKLVSRLLLVVMLTVTVNCVHESAHAMQGHVNVANDKASLEDISTPHQCPCIPSEEHKDYDGCDNCSNCVCHAPLAVQPFQLGYNPIVLDLRTSELFKHLPEVYLSKFVPPQIHA